VHTHGWRSSEWTWEVGWSATACLKLIVRRVTYG
jgi:hypothetical protein